jgi:hypothetical protein
MDMISCGADRQGCATPASISPGTGRSSQTTYQIECIITERLLEAVWALLQGPEGNKSVGNDRISHMANEKEHAESGSSSTQT